MVGCTFRVRGRRGAARSLRLGGAEERVGGGPGAVCNGEGPDYRSTAAARLTGRCGGTKLVSCLLACRSRAPHPHRAPLWVSSLHP